MSATARKHDDLPPDGSALPIPDDLGNPDGTEYATRGARGRRSSRPHLRMVTPLRPERASRGMFALIVTGLLGVGMVVILVINTSLAQGAFTVSELQGQQSTLTQREQALRQEVVAAAAPDKLEQQARDLGMVPSENPVFLDVSTGKVLGKPRPAGGARSTTPRLLTPADATVTEAVDNGGADFPAPLGAGYDPAAADAAAAQAKAAAESSTVEVAATPVVEVPATTKGSGAKAKDVKAKDVKAKDAKAKKKLSENSLWEEATVIDMTGQLSSEDSGLLAVPVE
jgi:hypothetical protein